MNPVPPLFRHGLRFAESYLEARARSLYGPGPRPLFLELESHYSDYDAMLKRDMLYGRLGVREQVASLTVAVTGRRAVIEARFPRGGAPLLGQDQLPMAANGKRLLRLRNFEGEAGVILSVPGRTLMTSPAMRRRADRAGRRFAVTLESDLFQWMDARFSQWRSGLDGLRLDAFRHLLQQGRKLEAVSSRRVGRLDVDTSPEAVPEAFRWLDPGLAAQSTSQALTEAGCRAILSRNGLDVPADAETLSLLPSEVRPGKECLALRYIHVVPDPDPAGIGDATRNPPHVHAGMAVVEDDYREYSIDAGQGRVVGEAWKWRLVGVTEATSADAPEAAVA